MVSSNGSGSDESAKHIDTATVDVPLPRTSHASALPRIYRLPIRRVHGPGRDRRFRLAQYHVCLRGVDTVFADEGTGEALLFIHGLAGNVTHWVNVAPQFTEEYRVLAIDLPGHGESGSPEHWSIQGYVEHVKALLDRLGIRRITVVGHSMGGMVAAALAIDSPDRVHRAVLVNPAGMQPMPRPVRFVGHLLLRERILKPLLPRVWKHGILGNVFYTKNIYTAAFIRTAEDTYVPARDIAGIAQVMSGLKPDLLERNFSALLAKLKRPVFLIWGDKDRLVPAGFLRRAAATLPHVEVEEIPDCGHMPIIEYPHRVVDFVYRALRQKTAVLTYRQSGSSAS